MADSNYDDSDESQDHKKRKARRRIRKARIDFVSLCGAGMNAMPVILKGADTVKVEALVKSVGDKLLGIVAVPETVDLEGDVIDKATISETAADFLARRGSIDMDHDGSALDGRADITASWIVDAGDSRFQGWTDVQGNPVNLDGAWAVEIQINDPELQEAAARGEIGGLSMGGRAIFEQVEKAQENTGGDVAPGTTEDPQSNQSTMTPEEIQELVAAAIAKHAEAAAPEPVAETEPAFDPFSASPEELAKHAAEAAIRKACAGLDLTDPAALLELANVRKAAYEHFNVAPAAETAEPVSAMETFRQIAKGGPVAGSAPKTDYVGFEQQAPRSTEGVADLEVAELVKSSNLGGTVGADFTLSGSDAILDRAAKFAVDQWKKGKTLGEQGR